MANTFVVISTVTVGSGGSASINFNSIPATYTDLCVKFSTRENSTNVSDNVRMTFNGATTLFAMQRLYGLGSGGVGAQAISTSPDFDVFGYGTGNGATASTFGSGEFYIPNYAGAEYKLISSMSAAESNATGVSMAFTAGSWSNTAAITSISLKPYDTSKVFMEYSTATLYGIKSS